MFDCVNGLRMPDGQGKALIPLWAKTAVDNIYQDSWSWMHYIMSAGPEHSFSGANILHQRQCGMCGMCNE
jgi:hypothetical protein